MQKSVMGLYIKNVDGLSGVPGGLTRILMFVGSAGIFSCVCFDRG